MRENMLKVLLASATALFIVTSARAQTSNGVVTIVNGSSGPVQVQNSLKADSGNQVTSFSYTMAPTSPVSSNSIANPDFEISYAAGESLAVEFDVMSTTVTNVGCAFRIVFVYQGVVSGNNVYLPGYYATPIYPPDMSTLPTCTAGRAPGADYAGSGGGYFSAEFGISGF